jgi:hypothetical protein
MAHARPGPVGCRHKFLRFFPGGFGDETYVDRERGPTWRAHMRWREVLDPARHGGALASGECATIAAHAVAIEARTNLLSSFEELALRDAVETPAGARAFAHGLYDFLHGPGDPATRFAAWCEVVETLPRRQTRVLTWPVATVFGFLAEPDVHVFLEPNVTRVAAEAYGYDFVYRPRPCWETYASLLDFARVVRRDLSDLRPRDQIDAQSFMRVQGSSKYDE